MNVQGLVTLIWALVLPLSSAVSVASTDRLREKSLRDSTSNADGPERISGYFKLDRTKDAHMFYFLFQSRAMRPDDPVVLWMTGGPGCSSELAIFVENGPWTINDDMTLTETQYGWDVNNTMIFVDQPINTGFSYSEDERDRVHDEEKVAKDMLDFLQELYAAHPELQGRDFFVTGESYAGHYVPAVTRRVWDRINNGTLSVDIRLKGFAIGNGLTDPAIQYGAYADYAIAHDLIDQDTYDNVMWYYPSCKAAIQTCNKQGWATECKLAVNYCQAGIVSRIMGAAGDFNVYDIRLPCLGPLCYDFSNIDKFLNLPSTLEWLGVGDRRWEECDPNVHEDMMGDWMKDFEGIIPEMINSGIRSLIYAGDQDFICNWMGNARWVDAMEWSGAEAYAKTEAVEYVVDGEPAWSVRSVPNLSFMKVYDAGHMVPMDKPKVGMEMIDKFTRNQPFAPAKAAPVGEEAKIKILRPWTEARRELGDSSRRFE